MGWVKVLEDGRWRAFESEGSGARRIQANAIRGTRKEARAAAQAMLERKRKGAEKGDELFSALAADYFELGPSDLEDPTLHGYRSAYRNHVQAAFGRRIASEIDPTDVLRYKVTKLKAGLAPNTVERHMSLLRGILGFGVRMRRLPWNAADAVKSSKRPKVQKKRRPLTTDEARTLIAAALVIRDEPDPPWPERARGWRYLYCLCCLSILAGLRRGEDVGLRRSDLELDPELPEELEGYSILYLQSNVVKVPGKPKKLKGTKSTKEEVRTVLLPPVVTEAIRAELRRQAAKRLADPKWNPEGYVFPNRDGGARHPDAVSHAVSELMERCGIEGADLHGLRHTHSTILESSGVDSEVIRKRQGHANIATTRGYMHSKVDSQKGAARILEETFGAG